MENRSSTVTLYPEDGECWVNGECVVEGRVLTQGNLVQFGSTVIVRFNHPKEALRLREERRVCVCVRYNVMYVHVSYLNKYICTYCTHLHSLFVLIGISQYPKF